MKTCVRLNLIKLSDPRVIRVLLLGLTLSMMLVGHDSIPCGSNGSCGGG
jgi:hypothetical protein